MERARIYSKHSAKIFQLFVTDGLTRDQAKLDFEELGLEPRLTAQQWKDLLRDLGIFKNVEGESAILDQTPGGWNCLVFADNVLQSNAEIIKHYQRRQEDPRKKSRHLQYFFLNARIDLESSFNSEKWGPDNQGLYARDQEFRKELRKLSNLHNHMFYAIKRFKDGQNEQGQKLLESAFALHPSRDGSRALQHAITVDLAILVDQTLQPSDPRRLMLQCLNRLSLDDIRPLYLAFDAFSRYIWIKRAGADHVKAYISYNQARFPRADAGEFYSLFTWMAWAGVEDMLVRVDAELGQYSHEAILLWQTAIEFSASKGRYDDMRLICQRLCERFLLHGRALDTNQKQQLNCDAAITFLLLGLAHEALQSPIHARWAFDQAVQLRNRVLPFNTWDATRESALGKLVEIDRRIGAMYTTI
ncbi:uncharacterized protein BJX67DRAFT_374185 [Aspergillus lucknowensis]|uniref:Clr5 domain-containing protein n=1 Tax=Aspergillus lucknowensis TaxID=176173 RepID=A0ABR4LKV3_9EURO